AGRIGAPLVARATTSQKRSVLPWSGNPTTFVSAPTAIRPGQSHVTVFGVMLAAGMTTALRLPVADMVTDDGSAVAVAFRAFTRSRRARSRTSSETSRSGNGGVQRAA